MSNFIFMYRYIPNVLTMLRMMSAPFLWYALMMHDVALSFGLMTFAIISDMGDGYVARRLFVSSKSGSFLDPLADKAVVIASFIAFCMQGVVSWWVLGVIVGRDIAVTWLRVFLLRRGISLRTSWFAKSKTAFQFIALYIFLIGSNYSHPFSAGGMNCVFYFVSIAVAVFTLCSSFGYAYHFIRFMRAKGLKNAR